MSGTQCYTLSYFPSLTTGKRVRVFSQVKSRVARDWEAATDTPTSPTTLDSSCLPRTTSLSWDCTYSGCKYEFITPYIPRSCLRPLLWSQYVVLCNTHPPLREGATRCGPSSSSGSSHPAPCCVDTLPGSSSKEVSPYRS